MNSLPVDEPKRSGRAEAWGVVLSVVGGPLLLLGIFGKTIGKWLNILHGSDSSISAMDERLKVWILLACVCVSSVLAAELVLQLVEQVLISSSSFIVTQPVECGRSSISSLSENFILRYRYEIGGKAYYKTVVSAMQTPEPDCQLHVHPVCPQLARHQNHMNAGALLIRGVCSFFVNISQLLLFMYALGGLRGASLSEYILGLFFCMVSSGLFLDFYRKQPNGGQQVFNTAPWIGQVMLGGNRPTMESQPASSSGVSSHEMAGYVAAL